MDYTTLKSLVLQEQYISMSDEEVLDAISIKNIPKRKLVPRWQAKQLAYLRGEWPILMGAQSHETPEIAQVAKTAVAYLTDVDFENLDMDLPAVRDMFSGLVQAGVVTQALFDEIDALASYNISIAENLGLSPNLVDIAIARGTRPLVQQETPNA